MTPVREEIYADARFLVDTATWKFSVVGLLPLGRRTRWVAAKAGKVDVFVPAVDQVWTIVKRRSLRFGYADSVYFEERNNNRSKDAEAMIKNLSSDTYLSKWWEGGKVFVELWVGGPGDVLF